MSQRPTKTDVLDAIDADERRWHGWAAAVGPENMEIPGAMGNWTFKDLAAHVNGWRAASLNRLEGAMTGAQPADPWPSSIDYEDYDRVNDWLHEHNQDRSTGDVMAETSALYVRIRSLVNDAPESKLFNPAPGEEGSSYGDSIVSGEFFSHFPEEHQADVTAWLESLGKSAP